MTSVRRRALVGVHGRPDLPMLLAAAAVPSGTCRFSVGAAPGHRGGNTGLWAIPGDLTDAAPMSRTGPGFSPCPLSRSVTGCVEAGAWWKGFRKNPATASACRRGADLVPRPSWAPGRSSSGGPLTVGLASRNRSGDGPLPALRRETW